MTKRNLYVAILAAALVTFFVSAAFAFSKSITVMVFTREKTVFVNGAELKNLVDFKYKISKGSTITASAETAFISYKGDKIEGEIKLKAADPALDKSMKKADVLNIDYYYNEMKSKKVIKYSFSGAQLTSTKNVKKGNKIEAVIYYFSASGFAEAR